MPVAARITEQPRRTSSWAARSRAACTGSIRRSPTCRTVTSSIRWISETSTAPWRAAAGACRRISASATASSSASSPELGSSHHLIAHRAVCDLDADEPDQHSGNYLDRDGQQYIDPDQRKSAVEVESRIETQVRQYLQRARRTDRRGDFGGERPQPEIGPGLALGVAAFLGIDDVSQD